jgi:ABC-type transport system involved in cytochrome c biogenesis permease component
VSLVPVLYEGLFSSDVVDGCIEQLRMYGSKASPGFMKAEGIIIYHAAARSLFKVTLEKDSEPKSKGIA